MKTLQEIKDYVCLINGCKDYKSTLKAFKDRKITSKLFHTIVRDICREVAKRALKNASEKAVLIDKSMNIRCKTGHGLEVDKQSILNESNIPTL